MGSTLSRRNLLRAVAAGASVGVAGCGADGPPAADGSDNPDDADGQTAAGTDRPADGSTPDAVGLETVVDGLRAPLDVAFAPDADRRYVADQSGLVHLHGPDGLADDPFLDLGDAVTAGGEKGLLGLALHPDFAENRRLFVRYSAPRREGTPPEYSHTFVLASVEATADGRRARRDSERTVLEVPQPQSNHNAGDLAFGPDGLLYVAVGDGGAGGDQGPGHAEDWYDPVEGGNGQDVTENLLGSILRLDVDAGGDDGYAVPPDNPLVGREGLDEQYAWGLRNPWRMAFDGEDLFVADVGQNSYEEVNLVEAGRNYGWNVTEGPDCYRAERCPDATPDGVRDGEPLHDPIVAYPHDGAPVSGISVIGGHVYRGSALPDLRGTYVFADLQAGGRLFTASRPDDGGQWPTRVLDVGGDDGEKIDRILSFGRDADGAVYVLGTGADGGGVHRIVPAP